MTLDRYNPKSLNAIIADSICKNWERPALSDIGGMNLLYKDMAENIAKLHIMFEAAGLKPGDKVAICGKNSSNWAVVFISCLTAGVVAVPILHEFKPDMIHHLVNHSNARLLFVDESIWKNMDESNLPDIEAVIYISELGMPFSRNKRLSETRENINEHFGKKFPHDFTPDCIDYYNDNPEDLAVINYTSGSTGMSKGVMLPFRSIWSNIRFCLDNLPFMKAGDGMVNMLPLAHLYGMVIEMLNPICIGCHCHFLTKLPSPKVILSAFKEVQPKLIITVPLVLEKIVKNNIFPQLEKQPAKFMLKLPFVRNIVLKKVKEKMMQAFGGNLVEIIVGGAPLNPDVEKFLFEIGFPVTVGYGMTECGPLITYEPAWTARPHSVGRVTDRMTLKIDSPDPARVPGDLWVKGDNVMVGYYKNEAATKEVMPENDGWMNTGDMCTIDKDGYLSISGRSKTMLLGPSGQNIYPEEIEHKLNNLPYVGESLVIQEDTQLVALVYPDYDALEKSGINLREDIQKLMDENIRKLNGDLPAYSKVARVKIMEEEFEKTPKRSIKRFLYQPK